MKKLYSSHLCKLWIIYSNSTCLLRLPHSSKTREKYAPISLRSKHHKCARSLLDIRTAGGFIVQSISYIGICPLFTILTAFLGRSISPVGVPSIRLTTSIDASSRTLPNTTCRPSNHGQATVVMKNCDPLVPGPAFAIDNRPGTVCFNSKFSSSNRPPS